MRSRVIGLLLAASTIGAGISLGQVGTATLSGVVTDPSGGGVASAAVELSSTTEAVTRTTKTGGHGEYTFPSLLPGSYQVVVHASGFADKKSDAFSLSSLQEAKLDITMQLAGTSSAVTVEASAATLQTTSASLGTEIGSEQVKDLPLLGGSFLNALVVAPAAAPIAPTGTTYNYSPVNQNVMPSVFGQRQKDNDFLVDGVEDRDPDFLGVPIYPPPEAIAEMTVDSGVGSAVYGHGSGAAVNVVTKSGSNEYHGALWEIFRNNVLEARSFFVPSLGAYRWNQFGVAAGGPVQIPHLLRRDKGWYVFGYYEGVRIRNAANSTGYVPTPAQISGNFSGSATIYDPYSTTVTNGVSTRTPYPNNTIPQNELNPTAITISKAVFPAPNLAAGLIPGVNYLNAAETTQNGDQWNGRVDHQFGQRDNFFARYTGNTEPSTSVSLPTLVTTTLVNVENVAVSDTHIISSTFLVTGHYGFIRTLYHPVTAGPNGLAEQSGIGSLFGTVLGMDALPSFTIPGYTGPGFGASRVFSHQNSFSGDAQKISGEHTIEFGLALIRTHWADVDNSYDSLQFATTQTANFNSSTGNAFGSFLLGVPTSAERQYGSDQDNQATNEYGMYAQDAWRHRRLTLNFGIRYDYAAVPVNQNGLGTVDTATGTYVWDHTNPLTGAAPNIRAGGIPADYLNFAPRFGFAYSITPKTIVRSSFGIFRNIFGSQYIQGPQGSRGNWPFSFPQEETALNTGVPTAILPNPFFGNPQSTPACNQCLNVQQSSTRTPYVQEWTFSLQRQLTADWVAEGDYFGSRGVKLPGQIIDDTAAIPGPGPITARQLWPAFTPYIFNNFDEFSSWYQAMSLQLKKRFSHGLQFSANYTYSKNLDDVDNLSNAGVGGQPTSNPTRFDIRKGDAGFDIPQLLVLSGVWTIPGHTRKRFVDAVIADWTVSGISNFRSGLPFMLFLTTDNENIGTVSGRSTEFPNLVGNPYLTNRTVSEWFNTSAFAVPALYTIGNVGRNILRTAPLYSTDFSVSKSWRFLEKRSVELRGEFFNILNHANFGYPGTQIGTAQFGAVANTLNSGRQVQLVGKIHF